MPKRFIDTEIWKKQWFRKLKPEEKCFYLYLITHCDHAGLFDVDLEAAEYFIGASINDPLNVLSDDFTIIKISDTKWFLIDFLPLQYPKGLNSNKFAVVSVVEKLKEHNLIDMVKQRFKNNYLTIKDKEEDKNKDMIRY